MSTFEEWRSELLFVGNIIQDSDSTVGSDEAERRFNRYIEMLDSLDGTEGPEYAQTIFESIQATDDYGAYQSAGHCAWKFGEEIFCKSLIHELPRLINEQPDWAGDFLVSIANGVGTEHQSVIDTFNSLLASLPSETQSVISKYISDEEQSESGWLINRVGVLGVNA